MSVITHAGAPLRILGRHYLAGLGSTNPWTNAYGLGRSLMALGTFLTLAFNPMQYLFRPGSGVPASISCDALAGHVSMFCLVPAHSLGLVRLAACAVLLVIMSGWRPQLTAPLHWWISWSFYASARTADGGDQVAAVLTLIMLPLALTDTRTWVWQAAAPARSALRNTVALACLFLLQIQIAAIYFDACIEKPRLAEWADGTNMYYILANNIFGAPHYLSSVMSAITTTPAVALLTWSVLLLEFVLGIAMLLPPWARRIALYVGLLFHVGIALFLGITTFGIIMMGALFIGVTPAGWTLGRFLPFWHRAKRVAQPDVNLDTNPLPPFVPVLSPSYPKVKVTS